MQRVAAIAKIAHEANRVYCQTLGDFSQSPWESAPEWQRQSAINGVAFHMSDTRRGPADSHENWCRVKRAEGWVYGPVKDAEAKEHPCLVEYHELPEEQRAKDRLFGAVVRALL